MNWDSAEKYCRSHSWRLAFIADKERASQLSTFIDHKLASQYYTCKMYKCKKKLVYTHLNGDMQRLTRRKQQKSYEGDIIHHHIAQVSMCC